MNFSKSPLILAACVGFLTTASALSAAPRQMENLGRGLVAINEASGKVFLSWRLLGADAEKVAFNIYRATAGGAPVKLNAEPIAGATNFVDTTADAAKANSWTVKAVLDGKELPADATPVREVAAQKQPYLSIPLQTPEGYTPNDASAGDLDGDGEYELIVHQVGRGQDNAFAGPSTEPVFQAYKLDGTLLWTINLGKNIREGAHYTQFMVYDLDGDGRAEFVCKTADGTVDASGKIIGDASADWREPAGAVVPSRDRTGSQTTPDGKRVAALEGRIMRGPEFLTVFDGLTGRALATTDYVPARGDLSVWGDAYANRSDRFLACVAYLDGERPSVVMCRGYYERTVLAAWNWRDGKLTNIWTFDSLDGTPGNEKFNGQGNHHIMVADVDADGRDEIVYGAAVIDDNGKGLYSTGLGHGDAQHTSDLDPSRGGLETFSIHENPRHDHGVELRDAKTGEMIWSKQSPDVGRGLAIDIDPRHPGAETWASGEGLRGLWDIRGKQISERKPRSCNFAIWWDGDALREILDGNRITKWDWENGVEKPLLTAEDCSSNNGTKSTPALSADLFGDWREEVVLRTKDGKALRIYTTTIPTEVRMPTLMHDPQYRLCIASQNVAYNQPPHVGFYLGEGMKMPARANITTAVRK